MKRVFLLLALVAISGSISAQSRFITRGAEEGELYMSASWYCNYGVWGDTLYNALLHITENGKKVKINHSVEYQSPDAGTADDLPMQLHYVMADATPGVVYIADWYMTYQALENNRLWFSDDYGKSWELRDKPEYQHRYYVSNFEGLIYRAQNMGPEKGDFRSTDYGSTWQKISDRGYIFDGEYGFDACEFFGIGGSYPTDPWSIYYTDNWFDSYIVIPIGEEYVFGNVSGFFPGIFRGGKAGEIYVTSMFPDLSYKVSFSADTGDHFRVVHQRDGAKTFMTDRKAGDFYIVTGKAIETQQPWGWYARLCFEYYTDYGETLVDIYCHDLTREGVATAVEEIDAYSNIMVYPNPTEGKFTITHHELRITGIEIFDVLGRKVFEQKAESRKQKEIDISHLPTGVYFVRIQTDKGVVTKKVVKK
ncbi:MAG: T9SS type A sorting domain-containing protein [Bacteroidales bacterium]|nr:T9SS type A sorting domain-containing protein [Bacteroidales bacterium]